MPELRYDPIQKRWVIITSERGRRPDVFPIKNEPPPEGSCPFCEANEGKTPPDPPYNFLIHTIPNVKARQRRGDYWGTIEVDFHWHIEFMPRLTRIAGFEWGTGFYINPTAPEEAAKYLRDVEL